MKRSAKDFFCLMMLLMMPVMAIAHPGHSIETQAHEFIHAEHMLVLFVVVFAVLHRIIKKFF